MTRRQILVTFTVTDPETWPAGDRRSAELDGREETYTDWAVAELADVVRNAAREWHRDNPGLVTLMITRPVDPEVTAKEDEPS